MKDSESLGKNHNLQGLVKLENLMVACNRPALEHVKRAAVWAQRLARLLYRQKHAWVRIP